MKAEAVAVNIEWIEAEAEVEAVKKILEAEAIKIYRFHRFHYSGFWGKIFSFFRNFFRNSTRFKANLDFNKVEAEAEAAILEAEAGWFQNSGSGSGSGSGLILR